MLLDLSTENKVIKKNALEMMNIVRTDRGHTTN